MVGISLFLAACTASNSQYFQPKPSSANWQGAKASDLLASLGKPFETIKGRSGTVYIYRQQTVDQSSINYSPRIGTRTNGVPIIAGMPNANHPTDVLTTNCFTTYTANSAGMITSVNVQGSHCRSAKSN
jgi:hypothetical protein